MSKKEKPASRSKQDETLSQYECRREEGDFPGDFPTLSKDELARLGKELLDKETPIKRKETILLELAHNGCWEALKPLEEYVRNPDSDLWAFAELAFEECRGWFREDPYGRDPDEEVYMGFERDKPCPCGSEKLYGECHGTLPLGPPTWEGK